MTDQPRISLTLGAAWISARYDTDAGMPAAAQKLIGRARPATIAQMIRSARRPRRMTALAAAMLAASRRRND